MKQYIIVALMLVILTSSVQAGAIAGLQYKDKGCIFCKDRQRTTNDYNVEVDADSLSGSTEDDFYRNDDKLHQRAKDYARVEDTKINYYIRDNEEVWRQDSTGTSMNNVIRYLMDDFLTYLDSLFVTKVELEEMHTRMDLIEADGDIFKAAMLKADRTGQPVIVGESVCYPGTGCIRQ